MSHAYLGDPVTESRDKEKVEKGRKKIWRRKVERKSKSSYFSRPGVFFWFLFVGLSGSSTGQRTNTSRKDHSYNVSRILEHIFLISDKAESYGLENALGFADNDGKLVIFLNNSTPDGFFNSISSVPDLIRFMLLFPQ